MGSQRHCDAYRSVRNGRLAYLACCAVVVMTSIRQTINALIPSRPDRKLVAENERLQETLRSLLGINNLTTAKWTREDWVKAYARACKAFKSPDLENKRLREALHKILRCVDKGDYELRANPDEAILRNSSLQIHSIACEALREPD